MTLLSGNAAMGFGFRGTPEKFAVALRLSAGSANGAVPPPALDDRGRGFIENKHSSDIESPSLSMLRSRCECSFSMTLLPLSRPDWGDIESKHPTNVEHPLPRLFEYAP
jgi:hypothetical protein